MPWLPRSPRPAARRWRSPPTSPTRLPSSASCHRPRRRSGRSASSSTMPRSSRTIPWRASTREGWDAHLAVNLRAPFVLSQEFAALLPADAGGAIVNLLDERVWNLTPYFVSYTVTKSALWTLTRTMALALAPRIRVNGIGPGPTLPSPRQSPEQFLARCRTLPLQARHQPRGDRRGPALHPRSAGDDRPDDRARWRRASRLGAARPGSGCRIAGRALEPVAKCLT